MRARRLCLLLALAAACDRPVTGQGAGNLLVTEVEVSPEFASIGTEVTVRFRAIGGVPASVETTFLGGPIGCQPVTESDGRLACSLGIISADAAEGVAPIVLRVRDSNGDPVTANTQVTIDLECPRFVSLSVQPQVAQTGDTVTVEIQVNEALAQPPRVSRDGMPWGTPQNSGGNGWILERVITEADGSAFSDVQVVLTDRAGNSNLDCEPARPAPFAVDRELPELRAERLSLLRGAPGEGSSIEATAGGVFDDVRVVQLIVRSADGNDVYARLEPAEDGSIERTSLGLLTPSRVVVEAVDIVGQRSVASSISEIWRVSVGAGTTAGAAIRTGQRLTPPEPDSTFLTNRTFELAPALQDSDTRRGLVQNEVGMQVTGELPDGYQQTIWVAAGYEPVGKAILVYGGVRLGPDNGSPFDEEFQERLLVLRWSEFEGKYLVERGPGYERGIRPTPRSNKRIAMDGNGCGVMFGGFGTYEDVRNGAEVLIFHNRLNDTWRVCLGPDGDYAWEKLNTSNSPGNRNTNLVYDPLADRYLVVQGAAFPDGADDAFSLSQDANGDWDWTPITPLPTIFGRRNGHVQYWDPKLQAVAVGLGTVFPRDIPVHNYWVFDGGQWNATDVTFEVTTEQLGAFDGFGRQGFGYDYDTARGRLVFWGHNEYNSPVFADRLIHALPTTATAAATDWVSYDLDLNAGVAWPTLVFDPDRETMVTFAGERFNGFAQGPEIRDMVIPPTRPHALINADLAATRPRGIRTLHLDIGAAGHGDRNDQAPGGGRESAIVVRLYDHSAGAWEIVLDTEAEGSLQSGTVPVFSIDVVDRPERFVSPAGVVPIDISTRRTASTEQGAQLILDRVDGFLDLEGGISLE